jgi:hypothetical protein
MPEQQFEKEWSEARGMSFVERVLKVKRIFRVSWKTVVYRAASRSDDSSKVWAQFYAAYKRSTGKPLKAADEPNALAPGAFSPTAMAVARAADEPDHLLPSDFAEDRLVRLVRKGVEGGVISLNRAADMLDKDLRSMRQLAAEWTV